MNSQQPIVILRKIKSRKTSNEALKTNLTAVENVSDLVRTTLGPNAMMKMIVNQMGTQITNDGNSVLRDVEFPAPAARFLVELSRTQDHEAGDGTTSVILLSSEIFSRCVPLVTEKGFHPNEILTGLQAYQSLALSHSSKLAIPFEFGRESDVVRKVAQTTLNSKTVLDNEELILELVYSALETVLFSPSSNTSSNMKNRTGAATRNWRDFIKLEKIPEGILTDSELVKGVVLSKEPISAFMPARLEKAKVLVLEGDLEYKKAESQTELEMSSKEDLDKLLKAEEDFVQALCEGIEASGANLVFVKGGTSPICEYFLSSKKITVFRRLTGPQMERTARATGAKIITPGDLESWDSKEVSECLGKAELFELRRIADSFYSFIYGCEYAKSCSIVLRGGSSVTMKEVEANIEDAIGVLYSLWKDSRVVVGGGGFEESLHRVMNSDIENVKDEREREVMKKVNESLLVVPKVLAENCGQVGLEVVREIREMNRKEEGIGKFGINGVTGKVQDNIENGIYDCYKVKESMIKTAVNSSMMLMRIGEVLSGLSNQSENK